MAIKKKATKDVSGQIKVARGRRVVEMMAGQVQPPGVGRSTVDERIRGQIQ